MKRGKKGVIVLLITGAMVWWGVQQYHSGDNGPPPLNTEHAERGDVSSRVLAHGVIKPVQEIEVGSEVSGILNEIYVDFNSRVERGQVIAQIDPSTFRAEVSSAEAQLEAAEVNKELAQIQWERIDQLRENQFIAPSEVDEARATLRHAEAQVRVQRHALERAQRELDRTSIRAPTDGIVISRLVDVGQTVAASLSAPELFQIATDLEKMLIHANVSEADIGMIREGQQVLFQIDAHRGREFTGEVIQVRNAPIVEDNVVHYETIIAVENREGYLKPGMTAEASIITDERENVLRLRNNALRARLPDNIRPEDPADMEEDEQVVYLLRDDEIVATVVRTGLNDGVYTEIISGLENGDELVVGLSLRGPGENGSRLGIMSGRQAQY